MNTSLRPAATPSLAAPCKRPAAPENALMQQKLPSFSMTGATSRRPAAAEDFAWANFLFQCEAVHTSKLKTAASSNGSDTR
jgi:hypothetical protein